STDSPRRLRTHHSCRKASMGAANNASAAGFYDVLAVASNMNLKVDLNMCIRPQIGPVGERIDLVPLAALDEAVIDSRGTAGALRADEQDREEGLPGGRPGNPFIAIYLPNYLLMRLMFLQILVEDGTGIVKGK
ncbi:MAG TPA: hypothetical protein VIT67_12200, partial [Povalibacter sp.]